MDFAAIDEHVQVVQKINRIMRVHNKKLRTRLLEAQRQMDDVFLELDSTPSLAEEALEKIRTLGGITCGPDDYDTIVKVAVASLANPIIVVERSKDVTPTGQSQFSD
jgi:hypothetical protein